MSKRGSAILLVIAAIVVTGIFGYLLNDLIHFNYIKETGIKTKATVIAVTSTAIHNRHISKSGIAVYYDKEGYEHEYHGYIGSSGTGKGDTIDIIYDKDNPDEVIKQGDELWLQISTVVSGTVSLAMIIFTVWAITHRIDKKQIRCVHQNVTNEELARVVREYMPQTREKFAKEKKKNRRIDKVTADEYVENMLRSGDGLVNFYNNACVCCLQYR